MSSSRLGFGSNNTPDHARPRGCRRKQKGKSPNPSLLIVPWNNAGNIPGQLTPTRSSRTARKQSHGASVLVVCRRHGSQGSQGVARHPSFLPSRCLPSSVGSSRTLSSLNYLAGRTGNISGHIRSRSHPRIARSRVPPYMYAVAAPCLSVYSGGIDSVIAIGSTVYVSSNARKVPTLNISHNAQLRLNKSARSNATKYGKS